jgi:predicted phosphodiesterase
LGCYGYGRPTSPNIDAVAREGVVFTNYFCSDSPCVPSRAGTFSGRPGIRNGVVAHEDTPSDNALRYANHEHWGSRPVYGAGLERYRPAPLFAHLLAHSGMTTASFSSFADRRSALTARRRMRVELIADIHGNLVALETVLAELEREPVDRLLCLGDVAALGPQPAEVVARLREVSCPSVLGNTDAWLLDGPPAGLTGTSGVAMSEISRWCANELSAADREYLRACPLIVEHGLGDGRKLLCFHGSPRSFDEVVSATTPEDALSRMLRGHRASVFAGGHTHVQLFRRHGDAHLLNPGSVGLPGVGPGTPDLPVNRGVRWAEYAVLEVGGGADGGRLSVDLRRVPVDVERTLEAARASGMPHLDWWIGKWGDARRGGRGPVDTG